MSHFYKDEEKNGLSADGAVVVVVVVVVVDVYICEGIVFGLLGKM